MTSAKESASGGAFATWCPAPSNAISRATRSTEASDLVLRCPFGANLSVRQRAVGSRIRSLSLNSSTMHLLFNLIQAYPLFGAAQVGMTIWMVVNAQRRGADLFWFWVILLFFPIGPWLYFFAVKIGDFRGAQGWFAFQRRAPTEELRYRAEKVPTLANHLALAQRLIEQHDVKRALPHLQSALALEPEHCQVLYGLANAPWRKGSRKPPSPTSSES